MRAHVLAGVCLCALASGVHAQGAENLWRAFLPLEIGDEWVYQESGSSTAPWTGEPTSFDRVSRYRVVRDTVVEGAAVHVVRGPGGEAVFGGTADGSRWIYEPLLVEDGTLPLVPMYLNFNGTVPREEYSQRETETIGGLEYEVDVVFRCCYSATALGIGLVRMDYSSTGINGSARRRSVRLLYASVGGREWGVDPNRPVRVDGGPESPLPLAVSPNPAVGGVWIQTPGGTGAVTIEVLDVLGRSVRTLDAASGARVYVSLSGVPPGIYVTRAFTGDGVAGLARFTVTGR